MTSIIVVNYKNPPLLKLCLSSLKRVLSPGFKSEIIVIDIASTPETKNIVKEFQETKIIPFKENIGYSKGVNEGIRNTFGDYILILNPDVIPMLKSIENLTAYLATHTDTGLAGPRLLNFDGSPQVSCFRYYTPMTIISRRTPFGKTPWGKTILKHFMMEDQNLNKTCEVNWLMGSAIMVSRKALEKVGLMDEGLFLYMSDVDWARRFWENGFKVVFHPESEMYHYHRRESKGARGIFDILFNKQSRLHLYDALRYFRKYARKNYSS